MRYAKSDWPEYPNCWIVYAGDEDAIAGINFLGNGKATVQYLDGPSIGHTWTVDIGHYKIGEKAALKAEDAASRLITEKVNKERADEDLYGKGWSL